MSEKRGEAGGENSRMNANWDSSLNLYKGLRTRVTGQPRN